MLTPRFYNSLTRTIAPVEPREKGKLHLYHCGPTVYARQHIGNMRRYLFADFLRRGLELLGYEIYEVMNITDVGHLTQDDIDSGEDKLEKAARNLKLDPGQVADEQIKFFHQDLQSLLIQPAHVYPRATQHIPQMIEMIDQLLKKGRAYITTTGVYFDVRQFPDYGKLSGNTVSQLQAGARVEIREEKRHPADFALWKLNDPTHLQQWDSPWGRGYPGWHIECSAMSRHYLGDDIDIHTGGEDNIFPHHENEIAQSEGATDRPFVRVWMHNRHLRLAGKKLAKREGTHISLTTLQDKGFSPLAFRLLVFGTHYRTPLEFSWDALSQASATLETIRQALRQLLEQEVEDQPPAPPLPSVIDQFLTALANDLNTPEALAVVMNFMRESNAHFTTNAPALWATWQQLDRVLGIVAPLVREIKETTIPVEVLAFAHQREEARKKADFQLADLLREKLNQAGFTVEDTDHGPRIKPL